MAYIEDVHPFQEAGEASKAGQSGLTVSPDKIHEEENSGERGE